VAFDESGPLGASQGGNDTSWSWTNPARPDVHPQLWLFGAGLPPRTPRNGTPLSARFERGLLASRRSRRPSAGAMSSSLVSRATVALVTRSTSGPSARSRPHQALAATTTR
jgi:hypothetical protein